MKNLFAGSTITVGLIIIVVLLAAVIGIALLRNNPRNKIRTDNLSEPLNGATSAKMVVTMDAGNLTVDRFTSSDAFLVDGSLQYTETQGQPFRALQTNGSQVTFTLMKDNPQKTGFRFPWDACNVSIRWQIHLNPSVSTDLTIHSGGGDITLDLTGTTINNIFAESGGGNIQIILPENASDLSVTANSGAGNVFVYLPGGAAARAHATTGLGKIIMDPRFSKIDSNTYQSADYIPDAKRIEITVKSGAGNVGVKDSASYQAIAK